jgi:hypothetical protein
VGGSSLAFLTFGVFVLLLPWPLAVLISTKIATGRVQRAAVFLLSLLLMFFTWWICGPPAKLYLIGRAHGLAHQFPIEQVRQTGEELLRKHEAGTLRTVPPPRPRLPGVFVDQSELPADLRGKFFYVAIDDSITVFFAFSIRSGILVGSPGQRLSSDLYPIQPGVYAYQSGG